MIGPNCTIADFDRIYNKGVKNHYILLGSHDKEKFDRIYCSKKGDAQDKDAILAQQNVSDDEEEENVGQDNESNLEDAHNRHKLVLQRQFFEAIVRGAANKFACGDDGLNLNNMAEKLDYLFKNNFHPLAVKNRSKTQEEEKAFKVSSKVFADYSE